MDAERWRRVSALYHAAAAQQGADRVAFLVDACAGDEELRRDVESLLDSQSSAEQFLAAPAFDIAAQLDDSPASPAATRRRIGVYELRERIGVGGMGEVYRARDMRLGRDVAVKILPGAFATDPDRIARFEREARVLAALNHANIATLYGVEESDGVRALAIELVEGTTLSERLSQGSLPMRDALAVSRQIADALEAAHEKGIIHRDLKPANIKITSTGLVKLLDFGLAKAMDADAARNLSQMPTMTVGTTGQGAIVGTAAYMSPEQARGQPVDKRTDIWAFGCVLFEMLTGRPAFARHTLSDTLARILGSDPDWDGLPDSTPGSIRRLLQRCLEKDSKRRIHDIADARIEIEDALASPTRAELSATTAAPAARWRGWYLALGALVLVAAAVTIGYVVSLPIAPDSREPLRFSIALLPGEQLPIDTGLPVSLAISPAGDQIVYAARTASGDRLYLRRLGDLEAVPIPGTEGAIGPFFSPDGQRIAFASGGMLRAVPISGGVPRAVAAAPNLDGASWGAGGLVVFSNWNSGLLKVSWQGGLPEPLTTLVPQEGEISHQSPHVLPQDRFVLFTVRRRTGSFVEAVEVATGSRRPILEGRNPIYLPSGHLVFARGAAVFAVPFDLRSPRAKRPRAPAARWCSHRWQRHAFRRGPRRNARLSSRAVAKFAADVDRQTRRAAAIRRRAASCTCIRGFLPTADAWSWRFWATPEHPRSGFTTRPGGTACASARAGHVQSGRQTDKRSPSRWKETCIRLQPTTAAHHGPCSGAMSASLPSFRSPGRETGAC